MLRFGHFEKKWGVEEDSIGLEAGLGKNGAM